MAMQALQLSLGMDNKDLIQAKTEELNTISQPYAERIMDEAVSKAMAGKKV
jgi:molecular chaperone HscA